MFKRFKKVIIGVAVFSTLLLVGCGGGSVESGNKLTVVSANTAVPYSYVEEDVHKGFEVDVWKEIAKRSGIEIEHVNTGFSGLFGMVDSGKADIAANFFGLSDERKEKYDNTNIYANSTVNIIVREDEENIKEAKDLEGKLVAICEGTEGQQAFEELKKDIDMEAKVYGDGTSGTQDLDLGRVDAYIESALTAVIEIEETGAKAKILEEPISSTPVAYLYNKDNENVKKNIDKINSAIDEMLEDGTYAKLSEEWFGIDVTKGVK